MRVSFRPTRVSKKKETIHEKCPWPAGKDASSVDLTRLGKSFCEAQLMGSSPRFLRQWASHRMTFRDKKFNVLMYKQLRPPAFPVLIYSPLWLVYRSLQKIWLAWLEGNLQDFQGNDVPALNSFSSAEGGRFWVGKSQVQRCWLVKHATKYICTRRLSDSNFFDHAKGKNVMMGKRTRLSISIKTTAAIKTCAHLNSSGPKLFSLIRIRKTVHMISNRRRKWPLP